ncbi:SAM-dependent methyltransferase [Xinfangfangia sp. CPCC 101601]|uniref:SAM-dependent methyltransferase n=1 Tax=Pseudogemmobacter lacusdianii TaxID=3069608 RepID=A0ABU0VVY7_9RHOB|nr:SAM-dependent methyltransferase [Xinfangfangia sp. CPCC 101601]MDQ2065919.1 SAM-dependent methyltransferase [Xinfangfangia sp. CPCC 101601]
MTKLAALLARRIAATGPITLADYMAECLLHPEHGYYTTRPPFGTAGDFTTAPEISQMFGELLGLCLAQSWLDQGAPSRFTLAELGPGRGTLMADVLRATRNVPGFHAAAQVTLVEASPALRAAQKTALNGHPATWLDHASALPDQPLFLLANEFFDALPIRQFTRAGEAWAETMVGLQGDTLTLGRAPALLVPALDHRLADTQDGEIVEICPSAAPIIAEISARILRHKGLALIVDYGGWISRGDTFQALRKHAFADPLAEPGKADLTAHVDFAALATAAQPAATAYTAQGALLLRLGLAQRAQRLAQSLTGATHEAHLAAARRLTDPAEMGELFKALALYPADTPPPAGFAPEDAIDA